MNKQGNILLILLPIIAVLIVGGIFIFKNNPKVQETYQNVSQKIEESKEQIRTTDEDIDKQLVNLDSDSKLIDESLNDTAIDVLNE